MRPRISVVLAAFAALAGPARADSIIADTFSYVGIYYGSAELFSPAGKLLSTTLAMTAETQFACLGPQVDQSACAAAMDQAIVQGFSNPTQAFTPPLPPVFKQDFLNQLPTLVDANGLGFGSPPGGPPFDPNNSPTPASQALFSALTTQGGNPGITGDTGFVAYGNLFDYTYAWITNLPIPTELVDANGQPILDANGQSCCVTTVDGGIVVQFFERDLQLTEIVATPEPRGIWLALVVVLPVLFARRRHRPLKSVP